MFYGVLAWGAVMTGAWWSVALIVAFGLFDAAVHVAAIRDLTKYLRYQMVLMSKQFGADVAPATVPDLKGV